MKKILSGAVVLMAIAVSACASETSPMGDTPETSLDGVDEQGSVTVNGVTLTALAPEYASSFGGMRWTVRGKMSTNGTAKQGVCLLQPTSVACDPNGPKGTTGHLACAQNALSGWHSYCGQIEGQGGYVCMHRPGSQTQYCGGSPVTGALVSAGTVYTPSIGVPSNTTQMWVSYACYAGCTASDPAVSSLTGIKYVPPPCGGEPMCGNYCC